MKLQRLTITYSKFLQHKKSKGQRHARRLPGRKGKGERKRGKNERSKKERKVRI